MSRRILDLCAGSGAWSQPYADAGYEVTRIDIAAGRDVRLIKADVLRNVHGVLAAPPCTVFAHSGSRWTRFQHEVLEGLSVVDACLRIIYAVKPAWWALENPRGKLTQYIGPAQYRFNPCDFGDPWTKETYLWGTFNKPAKSPVEPHRGSHMHTNVRNPAKRAITPAGFARAFFLANP